MGHENIASANLIHMNGRVYDPQIGQFLGPDRFRKGLSIASLNRFALGRNRSPNVIDPTGWAEEELFRFIKRGEKPVINQFTYANLFVDRGLVGTYGVPGYPQDVREFSLGQSIATPTEGIRRTRITLPGHSHLMMETMG